MINTFGQHSRAFRGIVRAPAARLDAGQTFRIVYHLDRTTRWSLPTFLITFTVFAFGAPETFINGDAVVYADQIREGNFAERTTHLGYFLVAYPFSYLPIPLSHALNLLNCAYGAGVVVLVGLIATKVVGSNAVGPLSALITAANALLVSNALHAEVYASQTFFLLLAIYLWLLGHTVWAGIGYGLAFLVTPSTALALPFFAVTRPKLRPLILFAGTASGLAVVILLPVISNYLFGARGLASAVSHGVDYRLALLKTGQDLFFGFFALLPFLCAGTVECCRRPELGRFGMAVGTMWVTVFLFGEKFMDVPVQLSTYVLAGIVAAIGVNATLMGRTKPAIIGAVFGFCIIDAILLVAPFVSPSYADHLPSGMTLSLYAMPALLTVGVLLLDASVRGILGILAVIIACNATVTVMKQIDIRRNLDKTEKLAELVRAAPNTIVVANWNEMVRMNWLVQGTAYHPLSFESDSISGNRAELRKKLAFNRALEKQPPLLLLTSNEGVTRLLQEKNYRPAADAPWWFGEHQ